MRMTPIGERRELMTIQQKTATQNSVGQPIEAPSVFATVYAKRARHSGREFFQAQQLHEKVEEIFNIRYIPGITTLMNAVVGGVTYDIVDVDDIEGRHAEINLLCKAVVP